MELTMECVFHEDWEEGIEGGEKGCLEETAPESDVEADVSH